MSDTPDLGAFGPRPAVIVPCLNRFDLSFDCVRAVRQTLPEALIVIVDNGSTDRTPFLDADVMVRNECNTGFASASNAGVEAAQGCDPLVFLNNDTVVRAGWYDALARALTLPRVAVATCRLVYPDGSIQTTGMDVARDDDDDLWVYLRRDEAESGFIAAAAGACVAVRRAAFEMVGGFDTGYWNGYEDVDLCFALWERGLRVVYTSGGTVMHVESASGPERFTAIDANIKRLRDRWGGWEGTHEAISAGFVPPRDGGGAAPPCR